jgi:anti-anti-sigma regulatory factor
MAYVSSAGLRVLVMMIKSLGSMDDFKMTGVSEDVRTILKTSGLDRLLLR